MKKFYINLVGIIVFGLLPLSLVAQTTFTPYDDLPGVYKSDKPRYHENYPDWAKLLYTYPVNFKDITEKFDVYRAKHPGEKNDIIRYFINWKKAVENYVTINGTIDIPEQSEERVLNQKTVSNKSSAADPSNWTFWGPKQTLWRNNGSNSNAGNPAPWQVNIYSFDVSVSNPAILYCGSETGFVNKTTNHGLIWTQCAPNYNFGGAILAVAIHPTDPNIVYVSAANDRVYKTTDGGNTWTALPVFFKATRLKIDPNDHNKIVAATVTGIYISADGGSSWDRKFIYQTWDVDFKPDNSNIIYGISMSSSPSVTGSFDVVISTDGGNTFTRDPNFPKPIQQNGALIATTHNNSNVLYASVLSNNGIENVPYIYKGVYNAGTFSWTLTKTGTSGLTNFSNGQGYFDFVLEASPDDEDTVFWGTTSLWKSIDGGYNFSAIGGYKGTFSIHPDIQDLKILPGGEVWVSTDGGMSYSTDGFTNSANWSARIQGLLGSDMWGFDQGWNEDIIVSGRYHNGNTALSDTYNEKALRLGGGESATGWIVHGRSRQAVFKDINQNATTSIPSTISEVVPNGTYPFTKLPNMLSYGKRRGNLIEHPNYHSVLYLGFGNIDNSPLGGFWKSSDMGATWDLLYTFPNQVLYFDISHKNPNVLYADVIDYGLYKSEDGGATWINKSVGLLNAGATSAWYGRLHFVISPYDENTIYVCTQKTGAIQGKIFKSTDGGNTWVDWSGTLSTGTETKVLAIQPTSTGEDLVYVFANATTNSASEIFYRKENMADWDTFSNSYPAGNKVIFAQPFYRDGKIRAAGNNGVWESPLVEPDFTPPYITPWVDKTQFTDCNDEVRLNDHSMLNHDNVTWEWSVNPTPFSISDIHARNPIVVPGATGDFDVTLTVTKNGQIYTKTINNMFSVSNCSSVLDCNNPEASSDYNFDGTITSGGREAVLANLELDTQTSNTGSVSFTTGHNGGQAYNFDGTNTLTTNASSEWQGVTGSSARTITAWIKVPSIGANLPIVSMGLKSTGSRYALKLNTSGQLRIEIEGSGFAGTSVVPVDQWVHVAVTMPDGGNLGDNILYLNGQQYATSTATNTINTGASRVLVGAQMGSGSMAVFPFVGQIDELRIYECELTPEQIVKEMNGESLSAEDNLNNIVDIRAFPVPTHGTINIPIPSRNELKYSIFSVQGQVVNSGVLEKSRVATTFDLSNYKPGIYIIKMQDENGMVFRTKVVKK